MDLKKENKFFTHLKTKARLKMSKKSREKRKGLSGGKRFGPPPERGPNPQGIKVSTKKRSKRN